jgi:hypothetical protein
LGIRKLNSLAWGAKERQLLSAQFPLLCAAVEQTQNVDSWLKLPFDIPLVIGG